MNNQNLKRTCQCHNHSGQIESYSYLHNEPKSERSVILTPYGPSGMFTENYGYSYADYKPSQNVSYSEEEKEEKDWPGVV